MHIIIRNERFGVTGIDDSGYLPIVVLEDGRKYHIALDTEEGGKAAAAYWKDIVKHEPQDLPGLIGETVLANWEKGKVDGPGKEKSAKNLNQWIDNVVASHPDTAFGHFAGAQVFVELSEDLAQQLGFKQNTAHLVAFPCTENRIPATGPSAPFVLAKYNKRRS